jgi:hypothetical protein
VVPIVLRKERRVNERLVVIREGNE